MEVSADINGRFRESRRKMEALEAHWKDWESGEVDESYVCAKKWVEASTGAIDGSLPQDAWKFESHGVPLYLHGRFHLEAPTRLQFDFHSTYILVY